ncbi:hypothetical protein [Anaerosolibacter sp.]|uniref:hypothetical protein n=1 Tax=Anaerosolibacter sp. TaxID=1872527 RepID=UPI0039F0299A
MKYVDENGKIISVRQGLGMDCWIVIRESPGGGHRVKSKALPPVETQEECQRNLDAWAKKKGLKPVSEGM